MTRGTGAAAASEFDMAEGQVPKKAKRDIPSCAFSAASRDIRCVVQVPVNAGLVDGKEAYAN